MSDRRNGTSDGPGKPAHQERASPNGRPLLIRAQSIHRSRPRLLIRPEELFSADTVPRRRSDGGLAETVEGKDGPCNHVPKSAQHRRQTPTYSAVAIEMRFGCLQQRKFTGGGWERIAPHRHSFA